MMYGSEWTLKYDEPEVENVARGRHERPCFIFWSYDKTRCLTYRHLLSFIVITQGSTAKLYDTEHTQTTEF